MNDNSIDETRQKLQELGEAGLLHEDTEFDARAKRQALRGVVEAALIIALGVAAALATPHLIKYLDAHNSTQTSGQSQPR